MTQSPNLRAVDLNLLVVLDALLSEQHLSRAAARLNMSQPAVSHALARLRKLLDDPLFTREAGRMVPTLRALELTGPLGEAMIQIRALLGDGDFAPEARHVFRLALSDYGAHALLPKLMRHLRQIAPGVELIVTQRSREAMVAAVLDGEVDLALGVFPTLPAQIDAAPLFTDRYACLLDPRHQPQPYLGLSAALYWSAPHVLVAVHGEAATELDLALRHHGQARKIALILPHWSVAPEVIAGTDLILTVARRSLSTVAPGLVITEPPLALPEIAFTQIQHRRRRSDPALRWLGEQIKACLD
ncbi:LysR substrate-binding domain-containing protein [Paracoccus aminophilus]|uniref:Transcriptional regulator, LysR family n=1 Tax=Paracoccus aminophilus JCM 7686 TaxID=1367847 RepID=S5XTA9_PARAH|nr:LysR substrate-binding domain-containing protein [Paracoccus aminophilus]AGT08402.1 transcriptional regulator, LysR family [Paracoccus aminophilus JCM 7686]